MTQLMKPLFSENGSNKRPLENEVYGKLLKYMREAASNQFRMKTKSVLELMLHSFQKEHLTVLFVVKEP